MFSKKYSESWIVLAELLLGVGVFIISSKLVEDQATVITILYTSAVFLKNSLYFTLKYIDLEKERSLLEKIDNKIQLEEVMKLYNTIRPELKPFAKAEMYRFKNKIKQFSNEQRTGKLDQPTYYDSLIKYLKDTKEGDVIWACSTFLNEEWDYDANPREEHLIREFKLADKRGVKSKRLFILKKENEEALNPPDSNDNSNKFIKNLLPYLIKEEFPNTSSYAMGQSEYDSLSNEQTKVIGQGFCAFEYADTNKTNIFVADTVVNASNSSNKRVICGEVLVNEDEIKDALELFDKTKSLRKTLKEYVVQTSNSYAKDYLKRKGVILDEQ